MPIGKFVKKSEANFEIFEANFKSMINNFVTVQVFSDPLELVYNVRVLIYYVSEGLCALRAKGFAPGWSQRGRSAGFEHQKKENLILNW